MSDYDRVASYFGRCYIVENRPTSLAEKNKNWRSLSAILPEKAISLREFLETTNVILEGGNLDYCVHFCPAVITDLRLLFNGRLSDDSILFMTVSNHSFAQVLSNEYINLGYNWQDINTLVKSLAALSGYKITNLEEDVNLSYRSGKYTMLTFGWHVKRKK